MSATHQTLEERIAALEHEIQKMKSQLRMTGEPSRQTWWEKRAGTFKNDPLFDDIVEAGQTYRRSLPQDDQ